MAQSQGQSWGVCGPLRDEIVTFLSLYVLGQFWSVPVDQALKARPSFQLGMERPRL